MKKASSDKDSSSSSSNSLNYYDAQEELRNKGIYYITGSIEEDSLLEIHQDILLKHLTSEWRDDIQLVINSPGGYVSEMWALVDLLDWIRLDVRTTGLGYCCSAGAILLAVGTPGKRIVAPNTSIMIHGANAYMEGNKQQLVAGMKDVNQEYQRMVNFWLAHSKYKSENEVKKRLLDGFDKYLTPEEALNHGIVDVIIGKPSELKKPPRSTQKKR